MALSKIDVANMVTGAVPVANGGTAATTLAAAGLQRPNSKPIIINGDMAVSQRTTSTTIANDGLVTDRFKHQISHDGATTVTQESLSSGNAYTNGFANALKIDVTTADSSLSSSQRYFINYAIEGTDIQNIKKGTSSAEKLTLAFWVKATKTGTNVVRCYTPDSDRSCSQSYTISSSDTWEHKVLNFPADTTGTVIADDNTSGMIFTWGVAVGSSYTSGTLATTWAANSSANDYVGQVNNLDNTSNNFHLTGVQLEVGEFSSTTLPPFQFESFEENLARCHRYCYVMGASANAEDQGQITIGSGLVRSSGSAKFTDICGTYPQPLRTLPSLTQVGGDLADVFCYKDDGTSADPTSISVGRNTISLILTNNMGTSSGLSAGDATFQQCVENDTKLVFSAEL